MDNRTIEEIRENETKLINELKEKDKEIDRFNNIIKELSKDVDMWNKKYNEQFNIITELEKWLKKEHENGYEVYYLMAIQD